MKDNALRALARVAGIAVEWQNFAGETRLVEPHVLCNVLEALDYPCRSDDELAESTQRLARPEGLIGLPPLITALAGQRRKLNVDADPPRRARLLLEYGGARDLIPQAVSGGIELPAIAETGYHRLLIGDREIVLAVAPPHATIASDITLESRLWGLATQVYGLRRTGDGGIGDAACVAALAESLAGSGADAIALSPLHAMFTARPDQYGPYSPSSRLFLNPLHAAPNLVFGETAVARAAEQAGVTQEFIRLEALKLIDWPASAGAKLALLGALFAWFLDSSETSALREDFARFRADGAELLTHHAIFEALLAEQLAISPRLTDWHDWSPDLRGPGGAAVVAFAQANHQKVLFHTFLQWVTDRSLAAAQHRARAAGMRIGLIADLAVGMDPGGSHAWSRPDDILNNVAIGAPPDLFNPNGQQWGITTFAPRALADTGFAPFIATVRAALRNTGGMRIDHAMGLQRLWLVPRGESPADGAYLNYPLTDMLRLLALESHRHRAVVIGEDLGTVPDGFREKLDAHGIYGMRVLWFEHHGDEFLPPEDWDISAAAMTSTHDLPTVAGWWLGADIALRALHGVLGPGQRREELEAERQVDRVAIWRAFTAAGVAGTRMPSPAEPQVFVNAAIRFVARSASSLALLPLEDVLGATEQPNLPGTIDKHPNWRRRLDRSVSTILDEEAPARRLGLVTAERPRR